MNNLDFIKTDFCDRSCHTGVTFSVDILMTEECTGHPINLAGYTARLVIYDIVETNIMTTISGTITTPTSGIMNFTIPYATTEAYIIGMYYYHIELLIGTTVDRIGQGFFEVTA